MILNTAKAFFSSMKQWGLGLIFILLVGCGGGSNLSESDFSDAGNININIQWRYETAEALGASLARAPSFSGNVCEDYLITSINCTIYDASNDQLAMETWPCADRSGTIAVKAGSGLSLVLEGVVEDEVLWSGQQTEITVTADDTTNVNIEMRYIGGDETAPEVESVFPSAVEAENVSLNTVLTATFNEDVVSASLNPSTFTLENNSGFLSGSIVYSDITRTVTFTPDALLDANTLYTASLTTGVEDLAGIQLASDYSWSFETGAGPDNTPPEVTFSNPADGDVEVPVETNIQITFSEPMDALSVNGSSFVITDGNGSAVQGDISLDGPTSFILNPSSDFNYDTIYTATVTADVMDSAGNHMAADFAWSFTTRNLVVWPELQYTIRDIPRDGVPDVFVGTGDSPFLDIKPGTEDRAVLEYNIYSVSKDLTDANLNFYMGTLDPGGTVGTVFIYWFEADGFTDLDDWYPKTSDPDKGGLLVYFPGPNTNGRQFYSFPVKDVLVKLRTQGRGFIGFLFLATTTGTDRYYILNTSLGGTLEQRAKLDIVQ
jgi:hypothetical protein